MKQPRLPKRLQTEVDDARIAQQMEDALHRPRPQDQLILERAKALYEQQKYRKAGSYTLAEKYNLLDIFPPTVYEPTTRLA